MRLIYFLLCILSICLAGGISSGEIQKVIHFDSMASEFSTFALCVVSSICSAVLFIAYSKDENRDKRD